MLKRLIAFSVLSISLIFVSCNSSDNAIADAVGKSGSLVIVAGDPIHKSLGNIYDSIFLEPGSSQPPFFEILKPGIADFEKFYFNQRTVLVLVTRDQLSNMKGLLEDLDNETIDKLLNSNTFQLKVRRDVFARHQHIAYVFGNDIADIRQKLVAGKLALTHALVDMGIEDMHDEVAKDSTANDVYYRDMKKACGIGVRIPGQFRLMGTANNAWYFQKDEKGGKTEKSVGLIIHVYPFKDTTDFSYLSVRSARDTISKYMVRGEIPGTYMSTSESEAYPGATIEMVVLNGKNAAKVKGWWTIRGMSMAGPYLRYVVHEPSTNKILAFEGFVYRPELEIRESELRLIEAIALGIK